MRLLTLAAALLLTPPATAQDDIVATEAALKNAALKVAPSVVRIETTGGRLVKTDTGVQKGLGPTTGLVVSADGYILTSRFNFLDRPATVFVTVLGQPRRLAREVASDRTRMLTLLKIEASDLPLVTECPPSEVRVGRWALALGRGLGTDAAAPPAQSIGVVSALGRIYGKVIQCDAKTSPVNYGGPLVALDGRVMGLIVPASQRAESETAGAEWYDSGIAFAVPFADCMKSFERLKAGDDLKAGALGVSLKNPKAMYQGPLEVVRVAPQSAAGQVGVKPGDLLTHLDGDELEHAMDLKHRLGPKYAGDEVTLTVRRGDESIELNNVKLQPADATTPRATLGVLPIRDAKSPGVTVRAVVPKSPADVAGLAPGDRITHVAPAEAKHEAVFAAKPNVPDAEALRQVVAASAPGTALRLNVARAGGKREQVQVTLGEPAADVVPELPLPASEAGAKRREGASPKLGQFQRPNATLGREMWVYVPENYTPKVSHGVVVWLHRAGGGLKDADDLVKVFGPFCESRNVILVAPQAKSRTGWLTSEAEEVVQEVRTLLSDYTIDPARVVAHGMGNGGQMAFVLAMGERDLFRGVATIGASYGGVVREPQPGQPLAVFIAAGANDPIAAEVEATEKRFREMNYPVVYRSIPDFGSDYFPEATLREFFRWFDALDAI